MLFFGRTLWGGALAAGAISVAGIATCAATGQGTVERIFSHTAAVEVAASTSADGQVEFRAFGASNASATAAASAQVEFSAAGGAPSIATGGDSAKVDFSAAGAATGVGGGEAEGLRSARSRGRMVNGVATVDPAEPQIVLVVRALRALARAHVEGTIGYFGRGIAEGVATGFDLGAHKVRAAAGGTSGGATPAAAAKLDVEVTGATASSASAWGDPYFARGTVKYHDGNSDLLATATGQATCYVYTIDLAVGRATPAGYAERHQPGTATCAAKASGKGSMELVIPMVGQAAGIHSAASGVADTQFSAKGRGAGLTAAAGEARATTHLRGSGESTPAASAQSSAAELGIHASAAGQAGLDSNAKRTVIASGTATSDATPFGYNRANEHSPAPPGRRMSITGGDRVVLVGEGDRRFIYSASSRQLAA
ncbi:MAG: hypothetical protein JL55_18930 [Pseudomonas sp. BICA1-14]|nr:MAG: hypothetical protein JL55_18930 [[Pseudomonas] sp. BICA1-14]HBW09463.1 hypothetical protein [Pseudomonas sp.]